VSCDRKDRVISVEDFRSSASMNVVRDCPGSYSDVLTPSSDMDRIFFAAVEYRIGRGQRMPPAGGYIGSSVKDR